MMFNRNIRYSLSSPQHFNSRLILTWLSKQFCYYFDFNCYILKMLFPINSMINQ